LYNYIKNLKKDGAYIIQVIHYDFGVGLGESRGIMILPATLHGDSIWVHTDRNPEPKYFELPLSILTNNNGVTFVLDLDGDVKFRLESHVISYDNSWLSRPNDKLAPPHYLEFSTSAGIFKGINEGSHFIIELFGDRHKEDLNEKKQFLILGRLQKNGIQQEIATINTVPAIYRDNKLILVPGTQDEISLPWNDLWDVTKSLKIKIDGQELVRDAKKKSNSCSII